MVVALSRGFSRSSNLLVSLKFTLDRPRLLWQRKFGNFNTKLARTQLKQEIELRMMAPKGGFEGKQFNGVVEIYFRLCLFPWQRHYGNFKTKLDIAWPI